MQMVRFDITYGPALFQTFPVRYSMQIYINVCLKPKRTYKI